MKIMSNSKWTKALKLSSLKDTSFWYLKRETKSTSQSILRSFQAVKLVSKINNVRNSLWYKTWQVDLKQLEKLDMGSMKAHCKHLLKLSQISECSIMHTNIIPSLL